MIGIIKREGPMWATDNSLEPALCLFWLLEGLYRATVTALTVPCSYRESCGRLPASSVSLIWKGYPSRPSRFAASKPQRARRSSVLRLHARCREQIAHRCHMVWCPRLGREARSPSEKRLRSLFVWLWSQGWSRVPVRAFSHIAAHRARRKDYTP